ncbi:Vegetative incompatibility protein HET-E-1 [Ceratobasidium sp. AG-Ba]|nr:Vegetative incompatibility protein HET-E-1 [Ceratobasidium sp. AG-Ba]
MSKKSGKRQSVLDRLFYRSTNSQPFRKTRIPILHDDPRSFPAISQLVKGSSNVASSLLLPLTINNSYTHPASVGPIALSEETGSTFSTARPTLPADLSFSRAVKTATPVIKGPMIPQSEPQLVAGGGNDMMPWPKIQMFANSLTKVSEVFGPFKEAVRPLLSLIDAFQTVGENYSGHQDLKIQLAPLLEMLSKHDSAAMPPSIAESFVELGMNIQQELNNLSQSQRDNDFSRLWNAEQDAELLSKCYERIHAHIQRFTVNAKIAELNITIGRETETRLKGLPNSLNAQYSSVKALELGRGACTEGTRVEILSTIRSWASDIQGDKICWLNGMAGTGKTTIAYSLCLGLEKENRLAASFFCSRQLPECRDVNQIIPSIAYQLSRLSLPFRRVISSILETNPDIYNQPISDQFKQLLLGPMSEVKAVLPNDLVVVIDALDECSHEASVAQILEVLLANALELPVKFFVTSRPEATISNRMSREAPRGIRREMRLHELAHSVVQGDIRTYIKCKLESHLTLSNTDLDALVNRSGVLFIYAATVIRYVSNKDFARGQTRLQEVLNIHAVSSDGSTRDIDALYTAILDIAYDDHDLTRLDRVEMLFILHTVICAGEPLSKRVMKSLLNLKNEERVQAALLPLLSVLQISETSGVVTTLHESFRDYLLEKERSGRFYCDAAQHNETLAKYCLHHINQLTPFNVCSLESSYLFDRDVDGLENKIRETISEEVFYGCCYWSIHTIAAKVSESLAGLIFRFLSERLLLWMEIMNLKNVFARGAQILYEMERYSQNSTLLGEETKKLLQDGWIFMTTCSSSPVLLSTPHIYVSTLLFWPADSPIGKYYSLDILSIVSSNSTAIAPGVRRVTPMIKICTGQDTKHVAYSPDGENFAAALEDGNIQIWDARTGQQVGQTLEGHEWSVASVAYSPDGAFIASGSWDETVRIWNAHTYKQIGDPLRGHTEAINSISFSPDSAYIVSGSDDQTVIIWDAKLGKQDGQPLQGHTDVVRSVSYSPDGNQIVTGSYDKTVRLWDAHTREQIGHPFKGHTGEVDSVAFSPNGAYIVSGSQDQTIRVWDARTGKEACQPLHGHPGSIDSVAYSPDGAYIVSGSGDRNVCVWDAQTMNRVGQPLEGHTHWVNTVAYSPNSTYIMSSSYDGTVHIWSALRCQQACRLIEGHSRWVNSVSFSPNSAHVASGSDDGTVCIWDSTTGMLAGRPLEGHTDLVHSVSYSPDGTHIASGSQDKTICIWNVDSGQQVGDPLRGHTDAVKCISFSPDGTHIASGSCDGTVIIWDAKLGKQEGRSLQGYTGPVNSVSYSPIGERIVTGSDDGTVRVWDIFTREQIGQPFEHESSVCSVAYSPDGASIVSGSDDAAICTLPRKMIDPRDPKTRRQPQRDEGGCAVRVNSTVERYNI